MFECGQLLSVKSGRAIAIEKTLAHTPLQIIKEQHLAIEWFDLAFYFSHQGFALPIQSLSGRDFDPSLADAIFLNFEVLFVVKFNTNIMFKYGSMIVRATRID